MSEYSSMIIKKGDIRDLKIIDRILAEFDMISLLDMMEKDYILSFIYDITKKCAKYQVS